MKIKITAAICISVIAIILGVVFGSIYIPTTDVLRIIGHNVFGLNLPEHITVGRVGIVWSQRLPRTLLAFVVGAMLSVSGAVMQSVLRNPLASSYTLGVSSGASFGASLFILAGITLPFFPMLSLPIMGFVFGFATIFIVMAMAKQLDIRMENHTIILTGMVFALFINAITTLMFSLFREGTQRMVFWQMGSFRLLGWETVLLLAPISLIGILIIAFYKWELDIMTFGEEQAQSIGVNTGRVKLMLLITSAALTGSAIAFVGIIGFVDLVAPHIVRKIFGSSHKHVIPMSAIVGGTFMVVADLVARTITSPSELPVGAITAIIGAPFFAYIYFTKRKGH
ncbi:MAG: iron ABC transporter permease [Defluviitaleaceae bacterium]|nr:iron ABC transporter permease [Defluviitaleaceae bacterium]